LERVFQAAHNQRRNALVVIASPLIRFYQKQIMDLAIKNRLPCVGEGSVFADAGALISYGSDFDASHRRIAYFVDRILNGRKPADLPVEQLSLEFFGCPPFQLFLAPLPSTFFCNECRNVAISRSLTPRRHAQRRYKCYSGSQFVIFVDR